MRPIDYFYEASNVLLDMMRSLSLDCSLDSYASKYSSYFENSQPCDIS